MKKVSLYIPCYNAEKNIGSCLEGVFKQTYPIEEVLIIDDGSTDNTVKKALCYPVKIVRHKKNKGLAASRNTAFKIASNEFVASLDADCVPESDWLGELMKNFTDEKIAMVGGKLMEKHISAVADRWRMVHMAQHWGDSLIRNPGFLSGSNNVSRISLADSVGLFNVRHRRNNEDVDFSRRLLKKGFSLIYTPKARVRHFRQDTVRSVLETYWHWSYYFFVDANLSPDSIKNLLKKIVWNFRIAAGFAREDICNRNFSFLNIDLLLIFYHLCLDLKYYKVNHRKYNSIS